MLPSLSGGLGVVLLAMCVVSLSIQLGKVCAHEHRWVQELGTRGMEFNHCGACAAWRVRPL